MTGDETLASVFYVVDQHVVKFARYDSLDTALEAIGLNQYDEIPLPPHVV